MVAAAIRGLRRPAAGARSLTRHAVVAATRIQTWLSSAARVVRRAWKEGGHRRRARAEIEGMGDRDLADIGIDRSALMASLETRRWH